MLISSIKNKIPSELYSTLEFERFRPCQEKAIKLGLLDGKNLLVCTPTASGKTLVAEMGAVNSILKKKGKAIYIVPLKSLAYEKYHDFKNKYKKTGVKIGLSIGDLDSNDNWLEERDLIITTSEKLDSLMRHGAHWIKQVATVVVDEIHLLDSKSRGPTLEVLITLLRKLLPRMQLIALSATIGNTKELADWLEAELISDKWRPVKLYQGTFFNGQINFHNSRENKQIVSEVSNPTLQLIINAIKSKKQCLVFCPTKRSTETTALKISKLLKEKTELNKPSEKILKTLVTPTKQCRKLSSVFKKGIAFHHSGVLPKQRHLIEKNFRDRKIKTICCTPTLALGVDTPADRVIMKSLKRFDGRSSAWIPVLEYHQMCVPYDEKLILEDGKQIKIGDFVEKKSNKKILSFNMNTKKPEFKSCITLYKQRANRLIILKTKIGDLKLTENHPVLTKNKNRFSWVIARNITKGDKVLCLNPHSEKKSESSYNFTRVSDKKKIEGSFPVYNLQVEDNENYFASNILLHNCGRAGRPGKSKEGIAVSVANSENNQRTIHEKYICGEPEEITSKLAVEPVLRIHILSLISSGFVTSERELTEFFKRTFYGIQYGNDWSFELKIEEILKVLNKYKFISAREDAIKPTLLGKRISELYIDPLTAWNLIQSLKKTSRKNEFSILQLISNTREMYPQIRVRKSDSEKIENAMVEHEQFFLQEIPKQWDWDYRRFENSVKTSLLFMNWIKEHSREYLLEEFSVRPGELRGKLMDADWLLYACSELCKLLNLEKERSLVNKTRLRVKHGIKEELVSLVRIKWVGRKRARALYNAGWKKPSDIKKATPQKLAMILKSAKIANKLLKQVE